MARYKTPSIEQRFFGNRLIPIILILALVGLYYLSGTWFVILGIIVALYFLQVLYGFVLLCLANWQWRSRKIRCLIVTSCSPRWEQYIHEHWIERLQEQAIILNWSERKHWRLWTLPVRLFGYVTTADDGIPWIPCVIILRGVRYPWVCYFHQAFRDAKHGRIELLQRMESEMFRACGLMQNTTANPSS